MHMVAKLLLLARRSSSYWLFEDARWADRSGFAAGLRPQATQSTAVWVPILLLFYECYLSLEMSTQHPNLGYIQCASTLKQATTVYKF
eukprot:4575809-Amphidinium_carterae.1